jgi:hypothetical protein
MEIDQSRTDHHAGHIEALNIARAFRCVFADGGDFAVAEQEISGSVMILTWINEAATDEEQGTHARISNYQGRGEVKSQIGGAGVEEGLNR